VPSPVSSIRTPRPPLLPLWEKGVVGMRGKRARERRREKGRQDSSREHAARAPMMGHKVERGCPDLAGLRGRFFGKPRRAISRFRQQETQTPPSPLVGEGGWGDEGQQRLEMQQGNRASRRGFGGRSSTRRCDRTLYPHVGAPMTGMSVTWYVHMWSSRDAGDHKVIINRRGHQRTAANHTPRADRTLRKHRGADTN